MALLPSFYRKTRAAAFLLLCGLAFCGFAQERKPDAKALEAVFGSNAPFRLLLPQERTDTSLDAFYYSVGDRYAVSHSLVRDGEQRRLADGSLVYRMAFQAPQAKFMDLSFRRFHLPKGGYAYLLNPENGDCRGPYLPEDIKDSLGFSTDLLLGERAALLCHVPAGGEDSVNIRLHCVVAGQKAFFNGEETPACLINTACEEAQAYGDIVHAVVLIYMDGYLCSGTLINNTAQDGTPYVLTAAHCMENLNYPNYGGWKFYFNIASASCASNTDGPSPFDWNVQVMIGCQLMAKGKNSDFLLLKLNRQVPDAYQAFYSGWDRRNSPPTQGMVGIHHPKGDYKKISFSGQKPVTDDCREIGFPRQAFWKFAWDRGMTFQGSSGSGLFEKQSHRLIGTLTAINDVGCNSPTSHRLSWYGKLSYHWFANEETDPKQQLRPWLDPIASGALYINGSYFPKQPVKIQTPDSVRLKIYPNPVTDALHLQSAEPLLSVEIISAQGCCLRRIAPYDTEKNIPLSDLPNGIYVLRVRGVQQVWHRKILLAHP
ncbi:MAG: T9SS type A sorting domain-containing protein [Bacteroidales bacterium]|nr:T9SS type A sorting domain-containing protein [Bacteroidales bacterium]